jgi:predicted GNAT superfamily acetyltransferase
VPEDIVALRREQPVVARAWRVALRDTLTKLLAAGYEITGATRRGWYVLELQ